MAEPGPPFGVSPGPEMEAESLLDMYVLGAPDGHASDGRLHIEGLVLMGAAFTALAIRLGQDAFLVRADVPADVVPLRAELGQALIDRAIVPLEADHPLGQIVGIEVTGQRGAVWDLWGRHAVTALSALQERAAGEFGPLVATIDAEEAERVERTLADMERELR
jgi:hypothetical protein